MPAKLPDEEREKIVALLREGKSQGQVASEVDRNKSTVSRIAKSEGVDVANVATEKATVARAAWNQARRVELIGKGMAHAEAMLPGITETRELQSWMMSIGIAVDKLRLESGEATDIKENRRGGIDLESEFRKLDTEISVIAEDT